EDCFATSSGMSAVFVALAALCGNGSRLVASRALFGSCFIICDEILPRWGVETVFVDGDDTEQWREALSVPTDAVFFESPSNPMQELVDVRAVCEDRKSTRLNSSHVSISYAVFCLKKKKSKNKQCRSWKITDGTSLYHN